VTDQQETLRPSAGQTHTNGQAVDDTPAVHEKALGLERIIFFSDAVFAIVITLLVLPLTAEIELPEAGRDLAEHVWS
jgi:hypothetical protein